MVILSRMFNITGKACSNGSLSSLNKFLNKTMSKSSFSTNQSIKFQQRIDPKLRFQPRTTDTNTQNLIWYTMGGLVIMGGMSYAAVPLFKIFCESQGMDANTDFRDMDMQILMERLRQMKKVDDRSLVVKFVANTSADLKWDFIPSQSEITVAPGETALAFFRAKNNTPRPIVGVATYTIVPYEAALYFNKIQCFCFEEQRLEPGEEVDMPVFFYIDDQYVEDPKLQDKDEICLSYTFFESKGEMPENAYPQPISQAN